MTPFPTSIAVVASDRTAARRFASDALHSAAYSVLEARTGEEALRLAEESAADLIVLDIQLPDLDGLEVCRRLRANRLTADIAVLHTSDGSPTAGHRVQGLRSGADGYLAEPFEPEELVATVQALLRARRAEKVAHELQHQAEEALRLRDEFLGMATHELRNPATTLNLHLEMLVRVMEGPNVDLDSVTKRLRAAQRGSKHLITLLHQLLEVSRLQEGRMTLRPREVDLREVVAEVIHRYSDEAARAHCTLNLHAPTTLPGLWDSTQMDQIVSNLISNAIKYAPGGPIDVSAVPWLKNTVLVTVRDHGPGISAEDQQQLFERFARVSQAPVPGFGLGLWITKRIVTETGGTIALESEANAGATFKVVLPRGTRNVVHAVQDEQAI